MKTTLILTPAQTLLILKNIPKGSSISLSVRAYDQILAMAKLIKQ